jgi:hypothetical protein
VASTIKKPEEIRDLLAKACGRRELLILATPFLRFESTFVAMDGEELHVLATMSREDALYGLRGPDLKMRFPDGLGFFEASVEALGIGLREGKHTVRLTLPKQLQENDQRVGFRVERVGRVPATFSTPYNEIFVAGLVDLSISGAKLHTQQDLKTGQLQIGDRILLDIPLSDDIKIHTPAQVRHLQTRRVGVEFTPSLSPEVEEPLSKWVFLKREEERERAALRMEQSRISEYRTGTLAPEMGILLISTDTTLEETLRACLKELRPLTRLGLVAQELKEAMLSRPVLAIFHLRGLGLDEKRRLKALVEMTQRKMPVLLLGSPGLDGSALFELASEWKASSALVWNQDRSLFLQRLVQGILRRHAEGGDSPMAPQERGLP